MAVTEYHPSCTCSMLPLSEGGVVGPDLRVHGVANLRVADSSVYPIQFAAHLMVSGLVAYNDRAWTDKICQAPTYGLAERAADMIKSDYGGIQIAHNSTSPNAAGQANATSSSGGSGTGTGAAASPSSSNTSAAGKKLASSAGALVLGSLVLAGLSLA